MDSTHDILKQFNQLQQTGLLHSLELLKKEKRELRRIITDISGLIAQTKIDSMLQFIITKFLDYFIPQFMAFIIKSPRKKTITNYCYRQLSKTDEVFPIQDYKTLEHYFENSKTDQYIFENIVAEIGTHSFTQGCFDLSPTVVMPLKGIGGIYGLVILSKKITDRIYTQSELEYIKQMFSILALTIQNGLHYETSITDPKTGLFTYDYFLQRTWDVIAQCKRYNRHAGLLMIDIDFFKNFNDTWGHITGDDALVTLSNVLSQEIRAEDCLARFGGEEFAILLSECKKDSLFDICERMRIATENIEMFQNNQKIKFTVSIGACSITSEKDLNPVILLNKADRALYISKNTGRNRTTIFGKGLCLRAQEIQQAEHGISQQ